MSELLEILMLVSFGASWPLNVAKSLRTRSAKGKSVAFLFCIVFGYMAGIASKFTNPDYMAQFADKWYVVMFYFLNMGMVGMDICLYFRNRKLDKEREDIEK